MSTSQSAVTGITPYEALKSYFLPVCRQMGAGVQGDLPMYCQKVVQSHKHMCGEAQVPAHPNTRPKLLSFVHPRKDAPSGPHYLGDSPVASGRMRCVLCRVMLSVMRPPSVSSRRPMARRMGGSYPEAQALRNMTGEGWGDMAEPLGSG